MPQSRTVELGSGLSARITWETDSEGDTSWLGTYTNKPDWSKGPVWDRWTHTLTLPDGSRWDIANQPAPDVEEDTHHRHNPRECRYVHGFQHSGTAKDFDHCEPGGVAETIAKHGSLDAASRAYCIRDAERLLDYGRGWGFIGCRVVLFACGIQLGDSSLWGIEDDASDSYFQDVERDQLAAAWEESRSLWSDEVVRSVSAALAKPAPVLP